MTESNSHMFAQMAAGNRSGDLGVPSTAEGAAEALKSALGNEMASVQGSGANTPAATQHNSQAGPSAVGQGGLASEGSRSSVADALKSALANNVASLDFSDVATPAVTQLGTQGGPSAGRQGVSASREDPEPLGANPLAVGSPKAEGGEGRQASDSTLVLGEALQFR